jgi:hypothetical protein
MRIRHVAFAVAIAFAAGAVVTGCSQKADYEKICNAEQLSGAAGEKDPSAKAEKIAQWMTDNIHSADVKKTLSALATVTADQRGPLLKQAAHEAGYDGACPMADAK